MRRLYEKDHGKPAAGFRTEKGHTVLRHYPPFWRYRLLRVLRCKINKENLKLLWAWAKIEGGSARWNPLNTELRLYGSTNYNSVGVQNYRKPIDGISATAMTLANGYYNGLLGDMQRGTKTAKQIVEDNAAQFDTWGTGAKKILSLL